MLAIAIERDSQQPIYRQIEDQIREAIRDQRLRPMDRLPTIRELAGQLQVARITVSAAYDDLIAEGYLTARVGFGTQVVRDLPVRPPSASDVSPETLPPVGGLRTRRTNDTIDLRPRGLGMDLFPTKLWGKLVARAWSDIGREGAVDDESSRGDPYLRAVLARRVGLTRGIRAKPSDVFVLTGVTAICDVVARAFLQKSGVCVLEDPGCMSFVGALKTHEGRLVPAIVDEHGLIPEGLPEAADMLLVSSSWTFPQGGSMPMRRRRAVLSWAREAGAVIYEHDWAGTVRFHGGPLPAIQSLDVSARAIYAAGFHEIIPAVRVGFAIVPAALREQLEGSLTPLDVMPSAIEQRALAYFVADGHLDRHLRRLRVALAARRQQLASAIESNIPSVTPLMLGEAGMQLRLHMPRGSGIDVAALVAKAREHELEVSSLSAYGLGIPTTDDGIIIDYSSASEITLMRGARRLSAAWRDLIDGSSRRSA